MEELGAALKTLLGSVYATYLKAHGFHWNVEGRDFHEFHDFFSDIYEDIYGSVDPLAENIRKIGQYAPFTLSTLDRLSEVNDKKASTDAVAMCVDLHNANEVVIKNIDAAFKAAVAANEQGIANFLSERDGMHKKWRWQLEATIKR